MYKTFIRPFLFKVPPEDIHHFIFNFIKKMVSVPGIGKLLRKIYLLKDKRLERFVFGIKFPNPVGLAAGFDKDALLFEELSCFGFGFIEIGTLTPRPQPGNPKPRMFRLKKDEALINRMGFNNQGVEVAAYRLKNKPEGIIIGGNIGKNKDTPNEKAVHDYEICFNALYEYVDYFVVNVSSPNTPGLRELQDKEPLQKLLQRVNELNNSKPIRKPLLLKIAPDLSNEQLDDIIDIVKSTGIDGVIATNTTIDRNNLVSDKKMVENIGTGGLSGKPLTKRSTEVIRYLVEKSGNAFPVIGVGGIHSAADAIEKLEAGAALIQIYTGFVYEGPGLIKEINKEILKNLG
jgi:dihydroorotate dehydrogenase